MPNGNFTLESLTKEMVEWANSVMPNRTPADAIKKLSMEEVPELWRSFKENGKIDGGEAADVLILILDICWLSGIDPVVAMHDKNKINRHRDWELKHGVMQHKE